MCSVENYALSEKEFQISFEDLQFFHTQSRPIYLPFSDDIVKEC